MPGEPEAKDGEERHPRAQSLKVLTFGRLTKKWTMQASSVYSRVGVVLFLLREPLDETGAGTCGQYSTCTRAHVQVYAEVHR